MASQDAFNLPCLSVSISFIYQEDRPRPWHFAFFKPLGAIQLFALNENVPFTDREKSINKLMVRDYPRPQSIRPDHQFNWPEFETKIKHEVKSSLEESDGFVGCEDALTHDYLTRLLPMHMDRFLITGKNPCTCKVLLELVRQEAESVDAEEERMEEAGKEAESIVGGTQKKVESVADTHKTLHEAVLRMEAKILSDCKKRKEEAKKKPEEANEPVIELS